MADFTKRIIFVVLYWLSKVTLITSSFYCEGGLCIDNEYCCDRNKCCPTSESNGFYILQWIIVGSLIIALTCGGLFRYKNLILQVFIRSSDKEPFAA